MPDDTGPDILRERRRAPDRDLGRKLDRYPPAVPGLKLESSDFSGKLFEIVINVQFVNDFALKGAVALGNVSANPPEERMPFDPTARQSGIRVRLSGGFGTG